MSCLCLPEVVPYVARPPECVVEAGRRGIFGASSSPTPRPPTARIVFHDAHGMEWDYQTSNNIQFLTKAKSLSFKRPLYRLWSKVASLEPGSGENVPGTIIKIGQDGTQ